MTSLRRRLGIGILLSLVVMTGLLMLTAGVAVRSLMEEQLVSRLEHDAENLLGGLHFDASGRFFIDAGRVQGIYQQPLSGHYFLVRIGDQVMRSRSLWDQTIELPDVQMGETLRAYATGPKQQPLLLWVRGYRKQGKIVHLAVAEELVATNAGIRRIRWTLLAWSLAVVFLLLLIQQYIVARSLRPVSSAADDVARLEQGEISSLGEQVPDEVRPLVRAINKLLQRQQQRLLRSREALGNLAHAVKTPLTLLQQSAHERLAAANPDICRRTEEQIQKIGQLVDTSLRRARLAGNGLGTERFDLGQDLPVLVDTLKRLHRERSEIDFSQELHGLRQLPLEKQDGMELMGNLLDNAWKWAERNVRVTVSDGVSITVVIEDDGPGMDEKEIELLLLRGARKDENVPGHGIGLSIVKSVVEDLGGEISYGVSEKLGGLKVEIKLAENRW